MNDKLIIFDLDNTILNGDSDYSWIKFMIDSGYVDYEEYTKKNNYFYEQYYLGNLDYDEWAKFVLSTFKGKDPNEISKILKEFLNTIIEPMINIYALRLLHEHAHDNDFMLLASATNSIIVNPIAERLGFKNIIATASDAGMYITPLNNIATPPHPQADLVTCSGTLGLLNLAFLKKTNTLMITKAKKNLANTIWKG